MINGSVYSKETEVLFSVGSDHFFNYAPFSVIFTDDYRFPEPSGVTFFPFWEPWAILITTFVIYFLISKHLWFLIRNQRKLSAGGSGD